MVKGGCKTFPVPLYQADAVLSQDDPVSGTRYVVLDTTKNVRIISVSVKCTWTVQPTPLQIWITVDGHEISCALIDPVSGTSYEVVNNPVVVGGGLTAITYTADRQAPIFEGRSIKVEAEITGGTVQNLTARVKYAKW
mgnify:CR=1 FL=1